MSLSKIAKALIAVPALAAGVVVSPHVADAAGVDASVVIDGIAGEGPAGAIALTAYHANIVVPSDRPGGGGPGGGAGAGAGKVQFKDITIGHAYDASSPKLATAAASQGHIKSAVFAFRRGSSHAQYLTITLTNVKIAGVQTMASAAGGDVPSEQVTLTFDQIEWSYRPMASDGSLGAPVKSCWNVRADKAC